MIALMGMCAVTLDTIESFTELNVRCRGLPGGKLLSFASPKESNQRKGGPIIPEFPKSESAGRASKELGLLLLMV